MTLVDSHCHLNMLSGSGTLEAVQEYLDAARDQGVQYFLNVSVDLETFPQVRDQAASLDNVFASVGVHPNHACEVSCEELIDLADHPDVIAIGETGLDYFRNEADAIPEQQERFRQHIRAANETGKPLIIHMRDAREDTLNILRQEKADQTKGVMHCFVEDWETARAALDIGFMISLSGIVTFKNATALQDVARKVPDDRLLVETDSPYLAPVPHRGKENQPAYVRNTAEFVADLRGQSLEHLASITTDNFSRLFGVALN
ncbi:MAG: TatD family deoxyribonuclease [Gammaproteobacteria bacterium]|nr:MAG: TatD family deoxyribonuclease [Gammaproteobacteria bacterium]